MRQRNFGSSSTADFLKDLDAGIGRQEEKLDEGNQTIAVEKEAPRLLVCTDYRVAKVEGKVESLVIAFQDLYLMISVVQYQRKDSITTWVSEAHFLCSVVELWV